MQPELVADTSCVLGESPLWHPDEERLYWTDVTAGRMLRYTPAEGRYETVLEHAPTAGLALREDGSLLMFQDRGQIATWREGQVTVVVPRRLGEAGWRFNDVFADPEGRVFCGLVPWNPPGAGPLALARLSRLWRRIAGRRSPAGRLVRLDTGGRLTPVLDGIALPNGMALTPGLDALYVTDSGRREISLFDYDRRSGALPGRRLFVRVAETMGVPDGLAVDTEGFVWSAMWNGGAVVRFAPDGRVDREIRFPARKVTSLAFGGPDLTDIFVTTAGGNDRAAEGAGAGALYCLNAGIAGLPAFRSRARFGNSHAG